MNGLSVPTLVVLALFALVAAVAVLGPLTLILGGLCGRTVFSARPRPVKALRGFLERAASDIATGFLNGVEWLVYGVVAG